MDRQPLARRRPGAIADGRKVLLDAVERFCYVPVKRAFTAVGVHGLSGLNRQAGNREPLKFAKTSTEVGAVTDVAGEWREQDTQ